MYRKKKLSLIILELRCQTTKEDEAKFQNCVFETEIEENIKNTTKVRWKTNRNCMVGQGPPLNIILHLFDVLEQGLIW